MDGDEEDAQFPVIIEEGLKEAWNKMRKEERCVRGIEVGRVLKWKRKARVLYVHYRTKEISKVSNTNWMTQPIPLACFAGTIWIQANP